MNFTINFIISFISASIFYLPRPIYLRIKYYSQIKNPHKEALENSIIVSILLLIAHYHIILVIIYGLVFYYIGLTIITTTENKTNPQEEKYFLWEKRPKTTNEKQEKIIEKNDTELKNNSTNITVKFCTNCGKEINENWNFCNHCGHKLK